VTRRTLERGISSVDASVAGGVGREVAAFLRKMAGRADKAASYALDVGVDGSNGYIKASNASTGALNGLTSPFTGAAKVAELPGGGEAMRHVREAVDQLTAGRTLLEERHGLPVVIDGFDVGADAASTAAIPFRQAAASIREAADQLDLHGLLA
jgi:hypothetical protein